MAYSHENATKPNVYVLDINLKSEINGITLGRSIRDREPNAYIIFLTAYVHLSMMVFKYKLKAFDFLVKPVTYAELSECLTALVEESEKIFKLSLPDRKNTIKIKTGREFKKIDLDSIIYIESIGPKLIIHTPEEQIEFYGTFKEIEHSINKMTDNFYRSHKSFLINIKHIKGVSMKEKALIMSNGDKCFVSRNKKDLLKELF